MLGTRGKGRQIKTDIPSDRKTKIPLRVLFPGARTQSDAEGVTETQAKVGVNSLPRQGTDRDTGVSAGHRCQVQGPVQGSSAKDHTNKRGHRVALRLPATTESHTAGDLGLVRRRVPGETYTGFERCLGGVGEVLLQTGRRQKAGSSSTGSSAGGRMASAAAVGAQARVRSLPHPSSWPGTTRHTPHLPRRREQRSRRPSSAAPPRGAGAPHPPEPAAAAAAAVGAPAQTRRQHPEAPTRREPRVPDSGRPWRLRRPGSRPRPALSRPDAAGGPRSA